MLKFLVDNNAPDIICLQETKTPNDKFPINEIFDIGYKHLLFNGEKSYNGVAILSKIPIQKGSIVSLCNNQARHISAVINGITIHNFYVPAGGDIPDAKLNEKFKHKLDFVDEMQKWFLKTHSKDDKSILLGDLNIAPYENDVWSTKQLRFVVSHTDIERSKLLSLKKNCNLVDSARHFVPLSEKLYSWWSYRNHDWQKSNRGRRLDHILITKSLVPNVHSIKILSDARNWQRPSDHVPVCLKISL